MPVSGNKIDLLSNNGTIKLIPQSTFDTISVKAPTTVEPLQEIFLNIVGVKLFKGNYLKEDTQIDKNFLIVNVDTIVNIPQFYKINTHQGSIIALYDDFSGFNSSQDEVCYIVKNCHKSLSHPILIENKEVDPVILKEITVKEKNSSPHDWAFIPLLLGMFIIASIVTFYKKYLGQLIESTIYIFSSSKYLKERNTLFQRLAFFLDFLFIVSISLLVDKIARKFGIYTPSNQFDYMIFLIFCAFLLALRIFRKIIYKTSALFSNQNKFFNDLYNNSSLYTRTLGVFLLPLVFFVNYTTGFITIFLFYLAILITTITLIIRIIRMFKVFVIAGFSIFYFILYLCALELAPLFVVWKEVSSR
ncbi:MAG: DUF4271 domain-containing protein [Bacteroidales bacterium]|nr:DUF4271 domain-containing protein [Bacteroidales bacterium]